MPSKAKKHSKTASRLSHFDRTQSSLSPFPRSSSASATNPDSEFTEDELLAILEEASSKYPSLIGTTAFIGSVTEDVAGVEESKGCNIWLSQSSMAASSIGPGTNVSVSLASSRKELFGDSPLSSLSDECAKHFGFGSVDKLVNGVGNYFALATVYPSCKVSKNGVRLSSNLSYTIGFPISGRIVFVYPIYSHSVVAPVNVSDKLHDTAVNGLLLHSCKELYLSPVSSKSRVTINSNMSPHNDFLTARTHGQAANGGVSSPMTPSFSRSKLSSRTGWLSSKYEESVSDLSNPYKTSFDSFNLREVLEDQSVKKLLQTCSTSWLCSRNLLRGNLVTIPILSEHCTFQVIGANKMAANSNIQNLTEESYDNLFPQALDLVDHVNDAFSVDRETKVYFFLSSDSALETPNKRGLPCLEVQGDNDKENKGADFSKLGGLSKEYMILKDIIISSVVKSTLSSLGLRPTKGVLLHGPPGTGKTSLARLCIHDVGVNIFSVNGPEIVNQYYGESEQALHEVFNSASQAAPAVVFIDELDAIAPARKDGGEELSQRMVATLLNLMDGICRTDGLLVIAATNRPDSIEPALRRPGRLDREIEIGVPSPKQRYDILLTLLSGKEQSLSEMEVEQLAMSTHGFVGADLVALCNEAALVCLRRYVDFIMSSDDSQCYGPSTLCNGCSSITQGSDCGDTKGMFLGDNLESVSSYISEMPVSSKVVKGVNLEVNGTCLVKENNLRVAFEDFVKARAKVRPSAMREVILEVPKVSWEDVGGQKEVKTQLMEAVEWPQKHQDAFKRIGTRPPTGVLMFGPPGCSKTLLARAVASEAGLNFLAVKGPELFSKWVGESEKAVRSLFAKARANAPSIIFFDEIDGLAIIRGKESDGVSVADRVMSQLLVELDGLHQRVNVTVIAATNRPDKIDPALLRPGRFDRLLYVGPPNEKDREDIFHVHLRKMSCSSEICIKALALLTEGCTGADISLICREAAVAAIEESLHASEITMEHLNTAIKQVQPSEIQSYQHLSIKFQRLVRSTATGDDLGRPQCSRIPSWKNIFLFLKKFLSRIFVFHFFLAILVGAAC